LCFIADRARTVFSTEEDNPNQAATAEKNNQPGNYETFNGSVSGTVHSISKGEENNPLHAAADLAVPIHHYSAPNCVWRHFGDTCPLE